LDELFDGLIVGGSVHDVFVGDDALDQLELFVVYDLVVLVEVILLIANKHLVTSLTRIITSPPNKETSKPNCPSPFL
jgi:hypothetical protein